MCWLRPINITASPSQSPPSPPASSLTQRIYAPMQFTLRSDFLRTTPLLPLTLLSRSVLPSSIRRRMMYSDSYSRRSFSEISLRNCHKVWLRVSEEIISSRSSRQIIMLSVRMLTMTPQRSKIAREINFSRCKATKVIKATKINL